MSQSGIYSLYCKTENLIYIGSSSSIGFRFTKHRVELRNGEHVCRPLQLCWNRHGRAGFSFTVLETCNNHDLLRYEQLTLLAASQIPGLTIANTNKSYGRSCGRITGKPVQSRLYNLNLLIA